MDIFWEGRGERENGVHKRGTCNYYNFAVEGVLFVLINHDCTIHQLFLTNFIQILRS